MQNKDSQHRQTHSLISDLSLETVEAGSMCECCHHFLLFSSHRLKFQLIYRKWINWIKWINHSETIKNFTESKELFVFTLFVLCLWIYLNIRVIVLPFISIFQSQFRFNVSFWLLISKFGLIKVKILTKKYDNVCQTNPCKLKKSICYFI